MFNNSFAGLFPIYSYIIIFLLIIVEGPVVTISSSFLAASGYLNIFILYPLIVIADLLADIMWYFVGYLGKEKIIDRWGRFIGLTHERFRKLERLKNKFKTHQGKILFTAKITHAVGFPIFIAAGLPVVAADSMAIPELVQDGLNGYLFEKGNAKDAGDKILGLINNKKIRMEMGLKSKLLIKQHDFEKTLDKFEEMYSRCLNYKPFR